MNLSSKKKKILKSCWLLIGVRFSFMLVANLCQLICQGVQRGLKLENGFQHISFRGCCAPLMLFSVPPQVNTPAPLGV